ncbi:MAG: helix-hairpin-helix domain-containing protein [Planctomycetaceae bacterium]
MADDSRDESAAADGGHVSSGPPSGETVVLKWVVLVGSLVLATIYVSLVRQQPEPLVWTSGSADGLFRVEVNSATWVEWTQLDGIGSKTAFRIIADREQNGPFRSIDDLQRVDGIGPITLERIRPHLEISIPDVRITGNPKSE